MKKHAERIPWSPLSIGSRRPENRNGQGTTAPGRPSVGKTCRRDLRPSDYTRNGSWRNKEFVSDIKRSQRAKGAQPRSHTECQRLKYRSTPVTWTSECPFGGGKISVIIRTGIILPRSINDSFRCHPSFPCSRFSFPSPLSRFHPHVSCFVLDGFRHVACTNLRGTSTPSLAFTVRRAT